MNKKSLDDRKKWTHLVKIFNPAAACGPGEVRGFASCLWSIDSCANLVKEHSKNELSKRGTNVRANLPIRVGGVPQKFLQKNASSVKVLQKNNVENLRSVSSVEDELQKNACPVKVLQQNNVEKLQTSVSSVEDELQKNACPVKVLQQNNVEKLQTSVSSVGDELQKNACPVKVLQQNNVEKLQTSASTLGELQKNACSLRELKNKEVYEKALIHLPQIAPQSQQLLQKNAFLTEKAKKMEKVEKVEEWNPLTDDGPWSLSPWVENVSEDEWFEELASHEEQKKNETKKDNSFEASTSLNISLSKTGPPKLSTLPKTEYSIKQLNSSVLPFPLGNRRRCADKTSKAEAQRAHKKTNLKAFKPLCAAQE